MSSTEELLKRLGVSIDAGTLRLALTHRSYAYENGGIPTNERLEFLGDSILGFSVTDALYRDNPTLPEGDLAKRRSAVVSTRALAGIGRSLGMGDYIYLGQGEKLTEGKNKASILADTMEALIGATYVSNDIETARQLVMRLIGPLLKDAAALGAGTDWKTSIQELAAGRQLGTIYYAVEGLRPGPRADVRRRAADRRHAVRQGIGPLQEGSRAGSCSRRLAQAFRRRHGGPAPAGTVPPAARSRACLNSPRSRWSAAAW